MPGLSYTIALKEKGQHCVGGDVFGVCVWEEAGEGGYWRVGESLLGVYRYMRGCVGGVCGKEDERSC